ncbi:MAG: hypothetical protein U5L09_04680 [Bacteroidales bacterium]|nr:hypothetical protein [Bacteroidales bacterium]
MEKDKNISGIYATAVNISKLGHILKKTTDTLTMTSNDRHIKILTDFTTGLTRLDQQCNRTKTIDNEEKRKSPRFAFLKISANAHCTHPANPADTPLQAKVCGKSAILPTHLIINRTKNISWN